MKDCWISEGRAAAGMRTRMAAELAANPVAQFTDIDLPRAVEILQPAIAQPTCPEQDDQIQDIATRLEILHARIRLITAQPHHTSTEPAGAD